MENRFIVQLVHQKPFYSQPKPSPCRLLPGALERDSLGGRTAASLIEGRSTSTGSIKVALTDTIYEKVRSSFFPATIRFALKPYLKEGEREEQLYM